MFALDEGKVTYIKNTFLVLCCRCCMSMRIKKIRPTLSFKCGRGLSEAKRTRSVIARRDDLHSEHRNCKDRHRWHSWSVVNASKVADTTEGAPSALALSAAEQQ